MGKRLKWSLIGALIVLGVFVALELFANQQLEMGFSILRTLWGLG